MLTTLAVVNYRTLRDFVIPLGSLTVVTGPNGSGKSNLYRALRLLADTAQGLVIPSLAREGGLQSTLWAGPEAPSRAVSRGEHPLEGTTRSKTVNLRLGFSSDDFGYAIDLGLPTPSNSAFSRDPEIKRECVWNGAWFRPSSLLVDRRGAAVTIRNDRDDWDVITQHLAPFDSMMTQCADPRGAPELLSLREQMRAWRFYDHFRSDRDAPARQAQIGTHTPVLGNDGADLAAALQTIREIGDANALDQAIADAFPGTQLSINNHDGRFEIAMAQHGLLRPLGAMELSDGTLRYLLLTAALLTPRPPSLMILNEPETSLHPDLLPALGRLIIGAAKQTQVLVVSHAKQLIDSIKKSRKVVHIELKKELGETKAANFAPLDLPAWHWPAR